MPIDFRCSKCGTPYRLKEDLAGKKARCRTCREIMTIPSANPSVAVGSLAPPPRPDAPPPTPAATDARPAADTPTSRGEKSHPLAANSPAPSTDSLNGALPNARAASPGQTVHSSPAASAARPRPSSPRKPVTPPPPADAESIALSALADEKPDEVETPIDQPQGIAMTCEVCDHQWTEPASKAGKQTLCPECQRRQKVPELKLEQTTDWRQQRAKLPSLARRDDAPLEGVQASTQTQTVSVKAMEDAGAIVEEYDPLPISYRLVLYGVPLLVVLSLAGLAASWWMGRAEKAQVNLIAEAFKEFEATPKEKQPPAAVMHLMQAMLELAAAEHELRKIHEPADLEAAHRHLVQAKALLVSERLPPLERRRLDRNAMLAELALLTLSLGGTTEQVTNQLRFAWLPEARNSRLLRVKEKGQHSVHEELQRALNLLRSDADFDFRIATARRLTRDLMALGQVEIARNLASLLFTSSEQGEAKAVVALEILRQDANATPVASQLAQDVEQSLSPATPAKGATPTASEAQPGSAQALFALCPPSKPIPPLPVPPNGPIPELTLRATIADRLRKDPNAVSEMIALTMRPANPLDVRLRGLLQVAEWASDPTPAIQEAAKMSNNLKALSPADLRKLTSVIYRLVQIAGQQGRMDEAEALANALPNGPAREWAKGETLRYRFLSGTSGSADRSAVNLPEDPERWQPGHTWGLQAVARQLGREGSGKSALADWPSGIASAFGLVGLSLGLQDRALK